MILLLDTTVLLDVLRARQNRRSLLAELVAGGRLLATAAINIAEVYAGMRAGEERERRLFFPAWSATQSPVRSHAGLVLLKVRGHGKAGRSAWPT
jgi:predicted nucleic acid-binding protein